MEIERSSSAKIDISSRFKTEVVTLRINPKMKFGLELISRLHGRSVAQTIELAINKFLSDPQEIEYSQRYDKLDVNIIDVLWSPHRGERLLKMVLQRPELLSYEEELLLNKMGRQGLLDDFFTDPAESFRQLIPGSLEQHCLVDTIAKFWESEDKKAKELADAKKKEKQRK